MIHCYLCNPIPFPGFNCILMSFPGISPAHSVAVCVCKLWCSDVRRQTGSMQRRDNNKARGMCGSVCPQDFCYQDEAGASGKWEVPSHVGASCLVSCCPVVVVIVVVVWLCCNICVGKNRRTVPGCTYDSSCHDFEDCFHLVHWLKTTCWFEV